MGQQRLTAIIIVQIFGRVGYFVFSDNNFDIIIIGAFGTELNLLYHALLALCCPIAALRRKLSNSYLKNNESEKFGYTKNKVYKFIYFFLVYGKIFNDYF